MEGMVEITLMLYIMIFGIIPVLIAIWYEEKDRRK